MENRIRRTGAAVSGVHPVPGLHPAAATSHDAYTATNGDGNTIANTYANGGTANMDAFTYSTALAHAYCNGYPYPDGDGNRNRDSDKHRDMDAKTNGDSDVRVPPDIRIDGDAATDSDE